MAEIQIDVARAERMIAQILRDEKRYQPSDANALAAYICRRLLLAMAAPNLRGFEDYRLIRASPPHGSDFKEALKQKIADVTDEVAEELWRLVHARGFSLPPGVADVVRR